MWLENLYQMYHIQANYDQGGPQIVPDILILFHLEGRGAIMPLTMGLQ